MANKTNNNKFSFWEWSGEYLLTILKKKAVRFLIDKAFGSSANLAGLKLWLAKLIIEVLWDYIGEPLSRLAIRKSLLVYDKTKGQIIYKKIQTAKEKNDKDKYKKNIGNV